MLFFYWITITGYIPVVLWKGQLDKNPMPRLSDQCNVHRWHRSMGITTLLGCNRNAGGWYKLLISSKTCHHTQVDSFVPSGGCAQSKEASQDHWLVDYSTVSAFGAYAIETKMQAVQVGTMEQSIRQARGQARMWILFIMCTALITESGLSYTPMIVICHIKEITAILCHLLPIQK